ncbi:MAG: DUF1501 domain-containing protein [Armatimonas sp.]
MGAWITFGAGHLNPRPACVRRSSPMYAGLPITGPANWSNGFLPAAFQGVSFNTERAIADLDLPNGSAPDTEKRVRGFLDTLNKGSRQARAGLHGAGCADGKRTRWRHGCSSLRQRPPT